MASRNLTKRQKISIKSPMMTHSNYPLFGSLARSSPASRILPLDVPQIQPGKQVNFDEESNRGSFTSVFDRPKSTAPTSRVLSNGRSMCVTVAENDVDIQDREESDSLDEVIMAVDLRDKGTVGCCYYVAREEKLHVMEDVEYGGIDVIGACKIIFSSLGQLLPVNGSM